MFILYPLAIALVVGSLTGGRISRLAAIQIRWWWLAVTGLAAQIVLFSPAFTAVGAIGPVLYVASSLAVLVAVVANWRLPGAPIVALGGLLNQLAILANGGYMPTSAAALALAGLNPIDGYSNSRELAQPALPWLTDIFALPAGVPWANVFSPGDILIGIGVAWLAFRAMRGGPTSPSLAEEVLQPTTPVGTTG